MPKEKGKQELAPQISEWKRFALTLQMLHTKRTNIKIKEQNERKENTPYIAFITLKKNFL